MYEVLCNEKEEFQGLYFYTKAMQCTLTAWPEFLLIDGTYNLFELGYVLLLVAAEDGNGLTEIIDACVVAEEMEFVLGWFVRQFYETNIEACKLVKSFMGDKDSTIRKVVKEVFNVTMYICIFHTQQAFRNAVTREKMNITLNQREWSLDTSRCMVYSNSLEEYKSIRQKFCELDPEIVKEYFIKNWDNCFEEWTKFSMIESNYGNGTNNRLESIYGKL